MIQVMCNVCFKTGIFVCVWLLNSGSEGGTFWFAPRFYSGVVFSCLAIGFAGYSKTLLENNVP